MPSRAISFFVGQLHLPLGFETETAQVGQQMPKNLELIRGRKTIELQHDRRIERSDVAVPDVPRHAAKVDGSEAAFESTCHWHLWNAVTLAQIFP